MTLFKRNVCLVNFFISFVFQVMARTSVQVDPEVKVRGQITVLTPIGVSSRANSFRVRGVEVKVECNKVKDKMYKTETLGDSIVGDDKCLGMNVEGNVQSLEKKGMCNLKVVFVVNTLGCCVDRL